MTFPRFFIDRPIFAIVLSVLMMIGGIVSFFQLPLSEYPAVTPPTVQVTTAYPGANPDVIAQTVATPLEQAITGVEGMLYMSSQSATDGRMILTITFDQHIDPDMAQIQVQNRVSRVLSRLPDEVQRQGVVTQKTDAYTQHRAHETCSNLVCRPLPAKKNLQPNAVCASNQQQL